MHARELLPFIKSSGSADMYSLNLWKWVKKHAAYDLFVAFSRVSRIDGKPVAYDEEKTQTGQFYLYLRTDNDGWLFGFRLSEILCQGVKASRYALPPPRNFHIIPDWWDRYIEHGKCWLDPEHWLYADKERWTETGDIRVCNWCGHHQHKHVRMVPRVEWVNEPATVTLVAV